MRRFPFLIALLSCGHAEPDGLPAAVGTGLSASCPFADLAPVLPASCSREALDQIHPEFRQHTLTHFPTLADASRNDLLRLLPPKPGTHSEATLAASREYFATRTSKPPSPATFERIATAIEFRAGMLLAHSQPETLPRLSADSPQEDRRIAERVLAAQAALLGLEVSSFPRLFRVDGRPPEAIAAARGMWPNARRHPMPFPEHVAAGSHGGGLLVSTSTRTAEENLHSPVVSGWLAPYAMPTTGWDVATRVRVPENSPPPTIANPERHQIAYEYELAPLSGVHTVPFEALESEAGVTTVGVPLSAIRRYRELWRPVTLQYVRERSEEGVVTYVLQAKTQEIHPLIVGSWKPFDGTSEPRSTPEPVGTRFEPTVRYADGAPILEYRRAEPAST